MIPWQQILDEWSDTEVLWSTPQHKSDSSNIPTTDATNAASYDDQHLTNMYSDNNLFCL